MGDRNEPGVGGVGTRAHVLAVVFGIGIMVVAGFVRLIPPIPTAGLVTLIVMSPVLEALYQLPRRPFKTWKPRPRAGTALAVAVMAPLLSLGTQPWSEPFSHPCFPLGGSLGFLISWIVATVPWVIGFGFLGALVWHMTPLLLGRLGSFFRSAAMVGTGLLVLLVITETVLVISRPSPWGYIERLPAVAAVGATSSFRWQPERSSPEPFSRPVTVTVSAYGTVQISTEDKPAVTLPFTPSMVPLPSDAPPFTVRQDRKLGLWVAENGFAAFVFDANSLECTVIPAVKMYRVLRPPPSWLALGWAACVMVAVLMLYRRRLASRAHLWESAIPGVLDEHGRVTLDGSTDRIEVTAPRPAPGPVVVLPGDVITGPYRGGKLVPGARILPGTLAQHREETLDRITNCDVHALGAIAIGIALPLASILHAVFAGEGP